MSAASTQGGSSTFYRLDHDSNRNEMDNSSSTTNNSHQENNNTSTIMVGPSASSNSPNDENNQNQTNKRESNESTSIEERQIHDSILREREQAHAKLQATLDRVRETTRDILNEIDVFLESSENVMVDYTKCQNSQRNEARRLEEVEPDVVGATERYLQQVQGIM